MMVHTYNPNSRDYGRRIMSLLPSLGSTMRHEFCVGVRVLTDSKMATPLAPIFPLGVTPRPPIRPAHRSLRTGKDIVKNKAIHLALLSMMCLSMMLH